jgi:hypothetical protein
VFTRSVASRCFVNGKFGIVERDNSEGCGVLEAGCIVPFLPSFLPRHSASANFAVYHNRHHPHAPASSHTTLIFQTSPNATVHSYGYTRVTIYVGT